MAATDGTPEFRSTGSIGAEIICHSDVADRIVRQPRAAVADDLDGYSVDGIRKSSGSLTKLELVNSPDDFRRGCGLPVDVGPGGWGRTGIGGGRPGAAGFTGRRGR